MLWGLRHISAPTASDKCAVMGQETENDPPATLDSANYRNCEGRQNADALDDGAPHSTDSGHKDCDSDNIAPETRLTFRPQQQSWAALSDYLNQSRQFAVIFDRTDFMGNCDCVLLFQVGAPEH